MEVDVAEADVVKAGAKSSIYKRNLQQAKSILIIINETTQNQRLDCAVKDISHFINNTVMIKNFLVLCLLVLVLVYD